MTIERKLVDYDPFTGIREEYIYDHGDDRIILEQTQDAKPVLDEMQRLRSLSKGWKADYVHVTSLTLVQCQELMKIGIMDRGYAIRDEAAFNVWLSNNNKLKATEGHF